eukprot:scaffold3155_cov358-Prasinococcus_capsulatus_cf.AAC.1
MQHRCDASAAGASRRVRRRSGRRGAVLPRCLRRPGASQTRQARSQGGCLAPIVHPATDTAVNVSQSERCPVTKEHPALPAGG